MRLTPPRAGVTLVLSLVLTAACGSGLSKSQLVGKWLGDSTAVEFRDNDMVYIERAALNVTLGRTLKFVVESGKVRITSLDGSENDGGGSAEWLDDGRLSLTVSLVGSVPGQSGPVRIQVEKLVLTKQPSS